MLFDALQEFPLRFPLPKHPLLKALIGSGPFHHFFAVAKLSSAGRLFPDSFLEDNKCWTTKKDAKGYMVVYGIRCDPLTTEYKGSAKFLEKNLIVGMRKEIVLEEIWKIHFRS